MVNKVLSKTSAVWASLWPVRICRRAAVTAGFTALLFAPTEVALCAQQNGTTVVIDTLETSLGNPAISEDCQYGWTNTDFPGTTGASILGTRKASCMRRSSHGCYFNFASIEAAAGGVHVTLSGGAGQNAGFGAASFNYVDFAPVNVPADGILVVEGFGSGWGPETVTASVSSASGTSSFTESLQSGAMKSLVIRVEDLVGEADLTQIVRLEITLKAFGGTYYNSSLDYTLSRLFITNADCNSDGRVDFEQILSGELDDDNANRIPDLCETSVSGVVPPSVHAQGGTTVTIKGANFPESPSVRIGGVAATDVVRLSATRISATTPVMLPGMASISVNEFTLEQALYIRPECGSDLDQDGEVTAADIAIVLLDFGPCYAPPSASQPEDSRPFMLREEPVPEVPKRK